MNIYKQLTGLCLLLVVLVVAYPVRTAEAVTISPYRIELSADPGETIVSKIKVRNDSNQVEQYQFSAINFESADETGQPAFLPDRTDGLRSWMQVPAATSVPAKQSQELSFTITIPDDARPGGQFAGIFVSPVTAGADSDTPVSLKTDVGALVLLRVNGELSVGEGIIEFDIKDGQRLFNHLPIKFYFRFQNTGQDWIKPLGDITIKNMFGGLTKIISANRGSGNVLPESTRRFDTAWISAHRDGQIETEVEPVVYPEFQNFGEALRYQWDNFALGLYRAELSLTVNNDASRHYDQAIYFWVLPWQLLLVMAAIVVFFVLPLSILTILLVMFIKRGRAKKSS